MYELFNTNYIYLVFLGNDLTTINKMEQIKAAIGLNLAIKQIEETRESTEGFVYSQADEKKIRYKKAEVLAVGNDVPVIKKGDIILYDGANGHTAMIGSEPITIILYRDVSLVVYPD